MSEELKISRERVLEAASKCSVAKYTLELLFPEVFEENKDSVISFDAGVGEFVNSRNRVSLVQIKAGMGKYAGTSLWLNRDYNWRVLDDDGLPVLVATLK